MCYPSMQTFEMVNNHITRQIQPTQKARC
ncbi:MAG: hypothetical protein OQK97_05155 [Deltaproteobacteria bacterium]|nr:hypothetical protein [Deltaproteobacteria bacterium]MCW8891711.1 hypothetical protein [Deltaproteobacteria bacterium]